MQGKRTPIVATALAVALLSTAGIATASPPATSPAHHRGTVTAGDTETLATGLLGPLRVAIGRGNTAYVSQNFLGQLTSVDRSGKVATFIDEPDLEIGGVSTHHGEVYYTESAGGDPENPGPLIATVKVFEKGEVRLLADTAALETTNNYDADSVYGFMGLPPGCAELLPPGFPPAPYGGDINSHPYATAVSNSGRYVYVADAGANAVLTIDTRRGTVDATVLESVPTVLTQEQLASLAGQGIVLPDCAVGATFSAEPVPTDIELGPDGLLYVTSLQGSAEDPTLGSVRQLDPATGEVEVIASGLTTPTGLALDRRGNIFVAELFANRISVIAAGTEEAVPFREITLPADVEADGKYLYATVNAVPGDPGAEPAPEPAPQGTLERTRLEYDRR